MRFLIVLAVAVAVARAAPVEKVAVDQDVKYNRIDWPYLNDELEPEAEQIKREPEEDIEIEPVLAEDEPMVGYDEVDVDLRQEKDKRDKEDEREEEDMKEKEVKREKEDEKDEREPEDGDEDDDDDEDIDEDDLAFLIAFNMFAEMINAIMNLPSAKY